MPSIARSKLLIVVPAVFSAILLLSWWLINPTEQSLEAADNSSKLPRIETEHSTSIAKHTTSTLAGEDQHPSRDQLDAALIEELQSRFGASIHHAHTQVKAVEKIVSLLKQRYPERWRDYLQSYLNAVFPEHAASLMAMFTGMENYNQWLESERSSLSNMSAEARKQLIWEMRYSYFGEQAKEIWAKAIQNETLMSKLQSISQDSEMNFSDKGLAYAETIDQVFGEQASQVKQQRMQELSDRFLSQSEVQQDLHQMPGEQRYQALRNFRQQLGMAPDALDRWTELDRKRDERWSTGETYMASRQKLMDANTQEDLGEQLLALQNELFGDEAEIIRNEEASGYYRFEADRIYGRN